MSVGARLCSLEEIMGDETRYTGCGFDDNYVWTSSTSVWNPQGGADGHGGQEDCSTGSAVVAMGASLWTSRDAGGSEGSPPMCRTMLGESAAVRCCADARRMCFDQGGQGSETHAFAGVTCTAQESLRTCDELSWFTGLGSDLVCGMSRVHGECNGDVTMAEALSLCVAVGARLCTVEELHNDETVGLDGATGCGFNNGRVWSSTRVGCGDGEVKTAAGRHDKDAAYPEECTDVTASGVNARCCADVARSCNLGNPCHPSNSLLTCRELGWTEVSRRSRTTQVGTHASGGSQLHICGESDGMTSQCHVSFALAILPSLTLR